MSFYDVADAVCLAATAEVLGRGREGEAVLVSQPLLQQQVGDVAI